MNKAIPKLVTFGRGGDCVHYGSVKTKTGSSKSTCTGYGTPERPHAADNAKREIPDGTPALDKRPAIDTPAGFSYAIKGPMVDVDLEPGTCSRLGKMENSIVADAVTRDPGNAFGQLINLHRSSQGRQKYGPLDEVAIDIYMARWKELGARTGHYENGTIIWDADPEPEPEAPAPEQPALFA